MKWWQWQGRGEYFAISFYSWGKVAYITLTAIFYPSKRPLRLSRDKTNAVNVKSYRK